MFGHFFMDFFKKFPLSSDDDFSNPKRYTLEAYKYALGWLCSDRMLKECK